MVLAGLINYYLILLFVYEDGPKDIFLKVRIFVGIKPVGDSTGEVVYYESNDSILANIFSCHVCFGFWSGLIAGLVLGLSLPEIFAGIALSVFMHEMINGQR